MRTGLLMLSFKIWLFDIANENWALNSANVNYAFDVANENWTLMFPMKIGF